MSLNRRDLLRASTALGATGAVAGVAGLGVGPAASTSASAAERSAAGGGTPLRVHIVMFDGVEELDFAAPYEVFSAARFFTDRPVEVRYVTASRPGFVQAAYGTRVGVEHGWTPEQADIIVVPGGGYARPDAPGVRPRGAGTALRGERVGGGLPDPRRRPRPVG
ncbi:DJ-1/PfpI family protein [Streptomyces sp. 147326]|uniref:DJ-1/PfpI family protein n=1 Tax=Streptomyces sp. 147326 TaxID=3074379 RepID=UPI0038573A2C